MGTPRPVNLNLMTIAFPLPAIVSILHRISGVILFLSMPFWIYALQQSLSSDNDFSQLQQCMSEGWIKFFVWLSLSALVYHFIAGVRHLFMDLGWGDSLQAGRVSSRMVMLVSVIIILVVGYWLW